MNGHSILSGFMDLASCLVSSWNVDEIRRALWPRARIPVRGDPEKLRKPFRGYLQTRALGVLHGDWLAAWRCSHSRPVHAPSEPLELHSMFGKVLSHGRKGRYHGATLDKYIRARSVAAGHSKSPCLYPTEVDKYDCTKGRAFVP